MVFFFLKKKEFSTIYIFVVQVFLFFFSFWNHFGLVIEEKCVFGCVIGFVRLVLVRKWREVDGAASFTFTCHVWVRESPF